MKTNKAAWSFVDYACGHSVPVRRGGADQRAPRPCPDCRANARDPYVCPRCHDTKTASYRFCGGERCRQDEPIPDPDYSRDHVS